MKRKEVSAKEQIMSKKKYISITFTKNSGYCVSHSSIFNNAGEKILRTVYCFLLGMFSFGSSLVRPYEGNDHKFSHLKLNCKRRLIVVDVRFENWGIPLG